MKVTINIPDSLSEISLGDYMELLEQSPNLEQLDTDKLMISLFCKVEPSDVELISKRDFDEIAEHLNSLFTLPYYPFIKTFKINDVEYGFIPNLEEISLREYADLSYLSDWNMMNKTISVLYRPITAKKKAWFNREEEQYSIAPYKGEFAHAEIMKTVSMDIVFGALFFLTNLKKELLRTSVNYLVKIPEVMSLMRQHNLDLDGDGIIASMH